MTGGAGKVPQMAPSTTPVCFRMVPDLVETRHPNTSPGLISKRRRCWSRRSFLLFVILLAGCTGWRQPPILEGRPALWIEGVPVIVQDRYQCGPAALAMVMAWGGRAISPDLLVPLVYTPGRKGSFQSDMTGAARRYGRLAYPISGMDALYGELEGGHPVIVLEDRGGGLVSAWHYSVVVGIDPEAGRIWLHSGRQRPEAQSLDRFRFTWGLADFWGLVVLPPGRLPASGDPPAVLRAVAALEQAGQWEAASAGYRLALDRWPDSPQARMGLGNSLYGAGLEADAAVVFDRLCRQVPPYAPGCNNLAHVLMSMNRLDEALTAARMAVEQGGPMAGVFEETLEAVLSRKRAAQ